MLDLVKHRFEEARELYADEWLGFSEVGSWRRCWKKPASPKCRLPWSTRKPETPQFQTLLAVGSKAN